MTEYMNRCAYVYNDGRRCRMPRVHEECSLCFFHWDREMQQQEAARIATGIVAATDNLSTARGVNRVLTRLFREVAAGGIHPRTASILAYLGHLILQTIPHVNRERKEEPVEPPPLVEPPQPVEGPQTRPDPPATVVRYGRPGTIDETGTFIPIPRGSQQAIDTFHQPTIRVVDAARGGG
jgi:hypothetical protein